MCNWNWNIALFEIKLRNKIQTSEERNNSNGNFVQKYQEKARRGKRGEN